MEKFNVFDLPLPFEMPPLVPLPKRDSHNVLHGAKYVPFAEPGDLTFGTRSTWPGVKVLRTHIALSTNELRAILHFSFFPYVRDIREEYPVYDRDAYYRAKANGVRMRRADLKRCDINLTLVLPPDLGLHYHIVSIKDSDDELEPPTLKREVSEQSAIVEREWTWQMIRGNRFTKKAYGNNFLMSRWITQMDIWDYYDEARILAGRVKTRSLRGTLAHILDRHARHMGVSIDHAFELFAVAASFGFLYVDHNKYLREDLPLFLLEDFDEKGKPAP
ncbi:hypothetical protein AWB78_05622 [Caballeronia calidae]|uniref:TnsA endonuclease N-terminal domain-containing protein n=1 Tax=Caballeronia calidae TaxID=1777139 RepID=A0A158DUQ2_9BURK|nr:hypothetical protein [Caballeronia calidae]SAK98150.1 hypothetical protein AWB78_05622 [Caballeronia calidae]